MEFLFSLKILSWNRVRVIMTVDANLLRVLLPIPIYITMVIALGFMLHIGYRMKLAYDYGKGLQDQCENDYLERERADYQAYIEYTEKGVKKQFQTAYNMFVYSIIALVGLYLVWLGTTFFMNVKDDRSTHRVPKTGTTNIGGVDKPDGFLRYVWKNKMGLVRPVIIPVVLFIGVLNVFSLMIDGVRKDAPVGINPFRMKEIKITTASSPILKETEAQIDLIVKRQYGLLITLFILLFLSVLFYSPVLRYQDGTTFEFMKQIEKINLLVIVLLGIIFIPMITKVIVKFQNSIASYYGQNIQTLNSQLRTEITEKPELKDEIQRNIVKAHPEIIKNGEPLPNLDSANLPTSPYSNELYTYMRHTLNYTDIKAITVPDDLRRFIIPTYLRGENLIALKKDLVKLYQTRKGIVFNPTSSTSLTDLNNTENQFSKVAGLPNSGECAFMKKYFVPSIQTLLLTTPSTEADKNAKTDFINLLNNTVITAPIFGKVNPLPVDMMDTLAYLRASKSIKDEINRYYTNVNVVVYIISFGFAYYLYHSQYKKSGGVTVQMVALTMFILLLIILMVGWLTKDSWI